MSNRPARLALVAALVAGALLLTGCSTSQAGAAAIVGDTRISEQMLAEQVQAILAAQRQPIDTASVELTQRTLGRLITVDLVDRLAAKNGVVVTKGDIDQELAKYDAQVGSREQLLTAFAEQDVAPSQIEPFMRMNLQAQALGVKLDPHGTAESQGKALFAALNELSDEVGVTASPRFGTWDPLALSVGPSPDDLTAAPAAGK